MRLGLLLGYSGGRFTVDIDLVRHAEAAGFDSVWTAEAYGSDAATPLAWIAAQTERIKLGTGIMQIPARAPAMTAMTALTLDHLSGGGRVILGLGPSGPQVVEGWYGASYGRPLTRTRECIEILRAIFEREKPVTFDGKVYRLPYDAPDGTGLGKPLKSILHPLGDIPIFTAAIAPKGVAASGELADGVIPIWVNPERTDIITEPLAEGFAKAGDPAKKDRFRIAPFVTCVMGDDLGGCRMPVKAMLALYIGGMGARGKNFYNDYATKLGYGDAARTIQDLYLDGKKGEAMAAVPDALVDEVALVGSAERIRDRLAAWKASPVTDMLLGCQDRAAVDVLAEAAS